MPAPKTRTLRFDRGLTEDALEKVRDNLSAIVVTDDHLWLGGDEGTSIHRMDRDASGNFDEHVTFELKDLIALPADESEKIEEIDIEGLDTDGGYLWLIGSHSAKRKKPEPKKTATENMQRLTRLELEGNRFTLARVPLDAQGTPVGTHGTLRAARLKGDAKGNALTDALSADPHLGRFVPRVIVDDSKDGADGTKKAKKTITGIPSKDNGFDVEGLAVSGRRVFLGLRGPVLRGWAVVLELELGDDGDGLLSLAPLNPAGDLYFKHFLDLGGLGVRELVVHGEDLLVLAGPSMDLDGPVHIYRWKDALNAHAHSLTWTEDLTQLVAVPFGVGKDHAEGLSLVSSNPLSLMVCYDSPGPAHLDPKDPHVTKVDLFAPGT